MKEIHHEDLLKDLGKTEFSVLYKNKSNQYLWVKCNHIKFGSIYPINNERYSSPPSCYPDLQKIVKNIILIE